MTANAADLSRLSAVIERQRRELDLMRAEAARRRVVDLARGMLMERLGCGPEEAAGQLSRLATESGTAELELAAELTGQAMLTDLNQPIPDRSAARRVSLAAAVIGEAHDGDGIAAATLAEALTPLGAVAVALWLLRPDRSLELVGQAGFGAQEVGHWWHSPLHLDCPARRVVAGGADLFWPTGKPADGPSPPAIGRWPDGARVAVAMRSAGLMTGVMEVCWPGHVPEFPPVLRRQLGALADLCGTALEDPARPGSHRSAWLYGLLDALLPAAMVLHPGRAADGGIADFRIGHVSAGFADLTGRAVADLSGRSLPEVYPFAGLPDSLVDHAREVLASGEPRHVSLAIPSGLAVDQHGGTFDLRIAPLADGVVTAWQRVDEAARLSALLSQMERLGRVGGWEEDLLAGTLRWSTAAYALFGRQPGSAIPLAQLHDHVPADDVFDVEHFRARLLRDRVATAAAFRIARADDGSLRQMRVFAEPVMDLTGEVTGVRGAFQDVSDSYHTHVALTATRDRLADTEERAAEEHRLAIRIQEAITPWSPEPIVTAGLDIAARYRPAGQGHLVSGDWYDTVLLPSEQVLLVVGDIAGHGIDAVTGMVALRNCLRGLAITGAGPGALLGWLNEFACYITVGTIGTAICGLYDPRRRTLRWARAGHLPPVLVRDGQARELSPPPGLLLGAEPVAAYDEITTGLLPGDTLLLFTDGLVERRDIPIDDAVGRLLYIAARPVGDIGGYADQVMRQAASDTGDDACLLAVRVRLAADARRAARSPAHGPAAVAL